MANSKQKLNQFYLELNRRGKRWIFRILDSLAIIVSIYLSFSFRFEGFSGIIFLESYFNLFLVVIPIKLFCFWAVGLYKPVIRYVGFEFLSTATVGVGLSSCVLATASFLLQIEAMPRSVLLLDALITLFLVILSRVLIRWFIVQFIVSVADEGGREKVLVYGAGAAGSQLASALTREDKYKVIAFIDDNKELQKQVIGGLKVYSRQHIKRLNEKYGVHSILLAIPSASKKDSLEIVHYIQSCGLPIKTVPGIGEIISGKVAVRKIRKIDITDLLGREEVQPIEELLKENIENKVVLVTGAGGSIGSELCRQICINNPQKLVLYERNEFALYSIDLELREKFPKLDIVSCLCSVTDREVMERTLSQNGVNTIYHAAAYKHVPLVEANLGEGIINNVFGTMTVVLSAIAAKVETFVLISTDKAVRPTNVMGTTKRIAELILQAHAKRVEKGPRFIMVRFGNVLNSTGSVVPRFRKQIANGEDLTLTHPDITRYFMSIPEAARLVIQAGALGKGGEVFLLDMGEPVRIYDLAKQMIKLSGLELGKDIDIKISGLRPGEKLYEELLIDKTRNTPTKHPKVFSAEEYSIPWEVLSGKINLLLQMAKGGTREQIVIALQSIVPEFIPASTSSGTSQDPALSDEGKNNVITFPPKAISR